MAHSVNLATKKSRQVSLYEQEMGAAALARQLVERKSNRRRYSEPDECNCGWVGGKARSFGEHHSDGCPRRVDPIA